MEAQGLRAPGSDPRPTAPLLKEPPEGSVLPVLPSQAATGVPSGRRSGCGDLLTQARVRGGAGARSETLSSSYFLTGLLGTKLWTLQGGRVSPSRWGRAHPPAKSLAPTFPNPLFPHVIGQTRPGALWGGSAHSWKLGPSWERPSQPPHRGACFSRSNGHKDSHALFSSPVMGPQVPPGNTCPGVPT